MPIQQRAAELPVSRQLDGEGEGDLVIARQLREERAWRRLPDEFEDRVHHALEYTIARQGLDECEAGCRRHRTDEWLESLRWGNAYDNWHARLLQPARRLTPKERAAQKESEGRAEELLRSMLTPKQLKEFNRRDYFHVVVGERRFRITRGRSHNIKEVDKRGRALRTFCAHPADLVPDADTMLSQKLCLETCPEEFLKLANVRQVERPSSRPRRTEEAAAIEETRQAEEDMAVFERAALDVAAGVEPEPHQPAGDVRAA